MAWSRWNLLSCIFFSFRVSLVYTTFGEWTKSVCSLICFLLRYVSLCCQCFSVNLYQLARFSILLLWFLTSAFSIPDRLCKDYRIAGYTCFCVCMRVVRSLHIASLKLCIELSIDVARNAFFRIAILQPCRKKKMRVVCTRKRKFEKNSAQTLFRWVFSLRHKNKRRFICDIKVNHATRNWHIKYTLTCMRRPNHAARSSVIALIFF